MTTNVKRVDAIGQELKVNECVYIISKSSSIAGDIGLITKLNAKTVQVNGKTTMEDCRVLIVTSNLLEMGCSYKIDDLRQRYENQLDHSDPVERVVKIPVRYVLLASTITQEQFLVRVEGDKPRDAYAAINVIPEMKALRNTFPQCRILCRGHDYRTNKKYLRMVSQHYVGLENIFALRSLPDNIARHVTGASYDKIPNCDNQADYEELN